MKNNIIILFVATTGLLSCWLSITPTSDTDNKEPLSPTVNVQRQVPLINHDEKYIDTKYEYTDSAGRSIIIQNSFPKSGGHYTDPAGKRYIYAVFWTRIINETDNPFGLAIEFPAESSELPSAPGVYFRLFFPPDTMTIDKEPLYDYGLTGLETFLNNDLSKSSSLKRTISPKASSAFYVVALSNKGVDGPLRTGFTFEDQNIFYRINKTEIYCGKINLRKLMFLK